MKQKDLFVLVLFFLCIILAVKVFRAYGEQIRLQWDHVDDVDGYRIYQTIRGGDPISHTFDFTNPVTTETYPDGKIPQTETQITIDLPGVEGEDTKYMFVARTFRGDDTSENSNEVSYVVSLVPPLPATELIGGYDKNAGIISIAWEQPPDEYEWRTVSHWIVYYRIRDGEWTAIGRIDSDHDLTMEAPFDAVAEGEKESVEFVIVSYRRSGVYSADSQSLTLDIDRRDVPPIQNLRINIEIPVE